MMDSGYYSERIDSNNKRIDELTTELLTRRLSIKRLKEENEKLFDKMNECTVPVNTHQDNKDKTILKLTNELDKSKMEINSLKKERTQLKHDLNKLKTKNKYLQSKCDDLKNENVDLKNNEMYLKSIDDDPSCSESNIFYKIREES